MSSTDRDPAEQARLIERLLADPVFRAAFRRNPAQACREHGLNDLADALSPGGEMHTLELRESKSSLAGVIMALAAEGIGVAELAGLLGNGGHAPTGHPPAALVPAADTKPHPGSLAHDGHASAGVHDGVIPGARASAIGAASANGDGPRGASDGVVELMANPHLLAPPRVRSELLGGDVDPRAVSVLHDIAARHTVLIGDVHAVTDPVHAQTFDIVSVDGQPVGPGNVAARDVLTEIAALDPGVRPDQIGSPWPIGSPGFFSDLSQQGRLRLTFVASADSQPAAGNAASRPVAHIAAASDVGSAAPRGAQSASPYVHPLPADAQIGRTDMGVDVDLKPGEPIVAIGDSRVLGIMPNWYRGQPYVALQLLDGPLKGHNYYVAEQIDVAVAPGEIVRRGQAIAHYAASGTGIEIGWAGPNWQQTLAQAQGNTGDASHNDAPAGVSFHNFLQSLGHAGGSGGPSPSPALAVAGDPGRSGAGAGQQAAPVPQPPVKPVTAVFAAPAHHKRRAFQRQTVEFRAPSSSGAEPPPSRHKLGHPPGAVADLSGAAISVNSPLLTTGQQKFAAHLAQLTGLDPRVISAWALAEESGGAAQVRQAAGNFNWLNIGYFDSGAGHIAFDSAFKDPITAAEQTARFLQGTWGGPSESIRAIVATAGQTPQQQIQAIASSNWASSHYGNGANLRATYDELSQMQITRS